MNKIKPPCNRPKHCEYRSIWIKSARLLCTWEPLLALRAVFWQAFWILSSATNRMVLAQMTTYEWKSFTNHFPGDGSTPLAQDTLNLYTIPHGSSIKRMTYKTQMSCQIFSAGATGLPLDFSTLVTFATGLWLGNEAGSAANSPLPLTDANTESWLFWDALQSRVDSDAVVSTGMWRVTWETHPEGLDLQTRRDAVAANTNDLWLAWEINDPFGVLNSSTDTYNAYLAGWYAIRFLISTP